jgi:hypothetical protein
MSTRRIDRAVEKFRAGKRNLYTDDGQMLYSDEEHVRREEALLEEFDREVNSVVSGADRTIEQSDRTLALEHRDLSDSLTTDELERANAKKAYVEDDVRDLPLEDLVRRVEAARSAGDKPTMFLYARTLPKRAEAEYEASVFPDQAAKLERLAKELAEAVRGPDAAKKLEGAEKEKRDANSLKLYAQDQRREIDGTAAAVVESGRAHIGSRL